MLHRQVFRYLNNRACQDVIHYYRTATIALNQIIAPEIMYLLDRSSQDTRN